MHIIFAGLESGGLAPHPTRPLPVIKWEMKKSPHALPGVAGAFGDTETHLELQIPTTQNQTPTVVWAE